MRPWTDATVPLAAVVRMVQVSTASPGLRSASDPVRATPSGTVQRSHKPGEDQGRAVPEAEEPRLAGASPQRCHS